jgi:hypothetical protein
METKDVIVVWTPSEAAWKKGTVQCLGFAPTGEPRVFERGKLDPRLGEVPHCRSLRQLQARWAVEQGADAAVTIPVTLARNLGLMA